MDGGATIAWLIAYRCVHNGTAYSMQKEEQ